MRSCALSARTGHTTIPIGAWIEHTQHVPIPGAREVEADFSNPRRCQLLLAGGADAATGAAAGSGGAGTSASSAASTVASASLMPADEECPVSEGGGPGIQPLRWMTLGANCLCEGGGPGRIDADHVPPLPSPPGSPRSCALPLRPSGPNASRRWHLPRGPNDASRRTARPRSGLHWGRGAPTPRQYRASAVPQFAAPAPY